MYNAGPGLCETCHLKPRFFDSNTKTLHSYCGKTCATKANKLRLGAARPGAQAQGTVDLCVVCHNKPRYVEGSRIHAYCGKTCAAIQNKFQKPPTNSVAKSNKCQIPGCGKPRWSASNYCGKLHNNLAKHACLICRTVPKQGRSHFCGKSCANKAQKKAVTLLEVPEDHNTFRSVANQFKISWRHNSSCPGVKHVYKIVADQSLENKYEAYKQLVECKGQFVAQGRPAGNENRRWHGTTRGCLLGEKGNTQFCASASCSLCCIIQVSFDVAKMGKKHLYGRYLSSQDPNIHTIRWLKNKDSNRFGREIYVSSTSSKSNDYSDNSNPTAALKAMLLNKVVIGKGCRKLNNESGLKAPPEGYDSILAERGLTMNHDECVVYNNDAIRPSFLVMYA